MKRSHLWSLLGIVTVLLLIGGPVAYAFRLQEETRNFRVVRPGVLYRSGQMTLDGLKRIIHDYRIRTVVSLRDADIPGNPPPDLVEQRYCRAQELNYFRIPPREWWAPVGPIPAEQGVQKFLEIVKDPRNHPVLVHCFAGVHRTGAHCALYRMECERWTNTRAIAEVKACGYANLDNELDVLGYLEQFRASWRD